MRIPKKLLHGSLLGGAVALGALALSIAYYRWSAERTTERALHEYANEIVPKDVLLTFITGDPEGISVLLRSGFEVETVDSTPFSSRGSTIDVRKGDTLIFQCFLFHNTTRLTCYDWDLAQLL